MQVIKLQLPVVAHTMWHIPSKTPYYKIVYIMRKKTEEKIEKKFNKIGRGVISTCPLLAGKAAKESSYFL